MKTIEYRVRPVTRYIVTRFYSEIEIVEDADGSIRKATAGSCGSTSCGEFDNEHSALAVAEALANAEPEGGVLVNGTPIERCRIDQGSGP